MKYYCLLITYSYGKEWIEKAAGSNIGIDSQLGSAEIKYQTLADMLEGVKTISALSINDLVLVPCLVEDNCWEVIAL